MFNCTACLAHSVLREPKCEDWIVQQISKTETKANFWTPRFNLVRNNKVHDSLGNTWPLFREELAPSAEGYKYAKLKK